MRKVLIAFIMTCALTIGCESSESFVEPIKEEAYPIPIAASPIHSTTSNTPSLNGIVFTERELDHTFDQIEDKADLDVLYLV